MNWKSKLGISMLLGVIALLFAISAFAGASSQRHGSTRSGPLSTTLPSQEDVFMLKEHNGYIAIYNSSFKNNPTTVTEIEVNNLRKVDRDMLEQGIKVNSREELLVLLEDLGS